VTPILEIERLTIASPYPGAAVLEELSMTVAAGETHALAGESGCGKTLTALAILGLLPEGFRVQSGAIRLLGEDVTTVPPARLRALRGQVMSMIFQEPMTALNPVLTVGKQICEALVAKKIMSRAKARERAIALLGQVGLSSPAALFKSYPHELSGGMRQRAALVMALAASPKLLVADEPTTALDATVQAQILELLREIQNQTQTAILFITHNLLAASLLADSIGILYAGSLMETGPAAQVLARPFHPYTRGLMESQPELKIGVAALSKPPARLKAIAGQVPNIWEKPTGCLFYGRCPEATIACGAKRPALAPLGAGRHAACPRAALALAEPLEARQNHA
jgi:peptide/nickel transport system ATP-binding protein